MPGIEPKGPSCQEAYNPMGPLERTIHHISNNFVTAVTYINKKAWQVHRGHIMGSWVLGTQDI